MIDTMPSESNHRSRCSRGGVETTRSEPVIPDAAAVARQVIESVQPVKMVDGHMGNGLRFGQAQVDGDTALAFRGEGLGSPEGDAAAVGAEMEFDGLAPDVGLAGARDVDALAFVVIGPEYAVAAADGAVAGGGGFGEVAELPAEGAAVAGAGEHDGGLPRVDSNLSYKLYGSFLFHQKRSQPRHCKHHHT